MTQKYNVYMNTILCSYTFINKNTVTFVFELEET